MDAGFELISWIITSGLFLILLYLLIDQHNNLWERKKVPCLKRGFIFGNVFPAFRFKFSLGQLFEDIYWKAGDNKYFGFYITNKPALLIKDPTIIKHVLVKDFDYFLNRNFNVNHKLDPSGSANIFINTTPRWKYVRAKITPMFTTAKIKYMFSLMEEVAEDLKKKILSEGSGKNGTDIFELHAQYTTDIISTTVLGFKSNCLTNPKSAYRKFGRLAFEATYIRGFQNVAQFLTPSLACLLRIKFFPLKMTDFLVRTFQEMVEYRRESKVQRNDLIDFLTEIGNPDESETNPNSALTYSETIGAVVSFFAAGFETSASTMSYTLYELAFNQEFQDLVRAEINEALAENDGKLTYEIIQNLRYLHWSVSEALRKYPLLSFLDRKCMADYKLPTTDLTIPAGTCIYISLDGLHKDPKYFPDPDNFDPYRFSDERKQDIVPYTYMPFGEGPRNCIGMRFGLVSAKTGLLHILKNFKVEPTKETPKKIILNQKSQLTAPKEKIKLRFTPVS